MNAFINEHQGVVGKNGKNIDLNDWDICGETPLLNACINGHKDVVKVNYEFI